MRCVEAVADGTSPDLSLVGEAVYISCSEVPALSLRCSNKLCMYASDYLKRIQRQSVLQIAACCSVTLIISIVQRTFAICGAAKTLRLAYYGKWWLGESRSHLIVY
jgi:hypothetical protein